MRLSHSHSSNPNRLMAALRQMHGFRQKELARAVNRSQAYVSLIEQGHVRPTSNEAQIIADLLCTDREKLFGEGQQEGAAVEAVRRRPG